MCRRWTSPGCEPRSTRTCARPAWMRATSQSRMSGDHTSAPRGQLPVSQPATAALSDRRAADRASPGGGGSPPHPSHARRPCALSGRSARRSRRPGDRRAHVRGGLGCSSSATPAWGRGQAHPTSCRRSRLRSAGDRVGGRERRRLSAHVEVPSTTLTLQPDGEPEQPQACRSSAEQAWAGRTACRAGRWSTAAALGRSHTMRPRRCLPRRSTRSRVGNGAKLVDGRAVMAWGSSPAFETTSGSVAATTFRQNECSSCADREIAPGATRSSPVPANHQVGLAA